MKRLLLLAVLLCPLSLVGQVVVGNGLVQYVTSAPSGSCSQNAPMQIVFGPGTIYTCQTNTWAQISGGGGGVTNIATTSPIGGGPITTTGTVTCTTCVVASSPGAGVAHFAGSTQTVTSSAIVAADITNATITGAQIASSVALAGSPTTTTQSASDNSTKVATTAYVDRVAPAMVKLESHAASTSATLDFTTCISGSTYHIYQFQLTDVMPVSTSTLDIQLSTNGGSTWDTTSSHYAWVTGYLNSGGTATAGSNTDTQFHVTTNDIASGANAGISGSINLYDPLNGAATGHVSYVGTAEYWHDGSQFNAGVINGNYLVAGAPNAVRFILSTGSISTGTITCYGITP